MPKCQDVAKALKATTAAWACTPQAFILKGFPRIPQPTRMKITAAVIALATLHRCYGIGLKLPWALIVEGRFFLLRGGLYLGRCAFTIFQFCLHRLMGTAFDPLATRARQPSCHNQATHHCFQAKPGQKMTYFGTPVVLPGLTESTPCTDTHMSVQATHS